MTQIKPETIVADSDGRVAQFIQLAGEDASLPLHDRLYRRIRKLILSGALPKGSKLPSSRSLAAGLGISRNSVLTALDRLTADGWIVSRAGSGIYVTYQGANLGHNKNARTAHGPIPFAVGTPPIDLFPARTWQKLQSRCWNHINEAMLHRTDPLGWPGLREAIAAHLAASRGFDCAPEQVMITTNTRSGLDLAIRVLGAAGQEAWVEDPGFFGARQSLSHSGVVPVPIPVDDEGMDIRAGILRAPDARFALVTPACQFPTCVAMSDVRRAILRRWAQENQRWIFEDDYDWHSAMSGTTPLPIATELPERTIYFTSFNHALFPALRLACVVVPPALVDCFNARRVGLEGQANLPNQIVLTDFINGGHLDAHMRRLKDGFGERRAALTHAIAREAPSTLRPHTAQAGMHIVCDLTGRTEQECADLCADNHLNIATMEYFCLEKRREAQLLMGFAAFAPRKIDAAARVFAHAMR